MAILEKPTAPPARPFDPEALLAALDRPIERVPVSALYRVGLCFVALTMLLLPVLYLALVALLGWGVYQHAVHNTFLLGGSGGGRILLLKATLYAAPIVAGVVAVLFMFKPILARPPRSVPPLELTRNGQPLLFRFVERLTRAIGSPMPREIRVDAEANASASFRRGARSFFGNDLVLTIGLPLVNGLTLRQFAGVLAHEFGHFAQGGAMRLTYLIRSVNRWFARVVNERDRWDLRLDQWQQETEHWAAALILALTRGTVWFSRRILWVLMSFGNLISSFMLRQMEFDADRYEARVAGSRAFRHTCFKLAELAVASRAALEQLARSWSEGRLADDLPALVAHRAGSLSADQVRSLHRAVLGADTGAFATHPADRDRIASAEAERAPGVLPFDQPAAALFTNLEHLSKRVTSHHYSVLIGPDVGTRTLVPTEVLVAAEERMAGSFSAAEDFFGQALRPLAPLAVDLESSPASRPDLGALRARMADLAGSAQAAAQRKRDADERVLDCARARELVERGYGIDAESFGLTSPDLGTIDRAAAYAGSERDRAVAELAEFEAAAGRRLSAVLGLLSTPALAAKIPSSAELRGECRTLVEAHRELTGAAEEYFAVRRHLGRLSDLVGLVQNGSPDQRMLSQLQEAVGEASRSLAHLRDRLAHTAYPFVGSEGRRSLADVLVGEVPRELEEVGAAAHQVAEEMPRLHYRVLGRLASIALEVERTTGGSAQR